MYFLVQGEDALLFILGKLPAALVGHALHRWLPKEPQCSFNSFATSLAGNNGSSSVQKVLALHFQIMLVWLTKCTRKRWACVPHFLIYLEHFYFKKDFFVVCKFMWENFRTQKRSTVLRFLYRWVILPGRWAYKEKGPKDKIKEIFSPVLRTLCNMRLV